MSEKRLSLCPCDLDEANAFVEQHHRHHGKVRGYKFALAAAMGGGIVGIAIIGRPVARERQDGVTLEVTRLATDGIARAVVDRHGRTHADAICSFLYGAAWRATRALGYQRLGTYILKSESGKSLKAAGWRHVGDVRGRSWSCKSRPRVDKHPAQDKMLFEVTA